MLRQGKKASDSLQGQHLDNQEQRGLSSEEEEDSEGDN